jgi:hypothetical protein
MRDDRPGDSFEDRWRIWRVTEPEPEFVRSRTREGTSRPGHESSLPERPFRRWWGV